MCHLSNCSKETACCTFRTLSLALIILCILFMISYLLCILGSLRLPYLTFCTLTTLSFTLIEYAVYLSYCVWGSLRLTLSMCTCGVTTRRVHACMQVHIYTFVWSVWNMKVKFDIYFACIYSSWKLAMCS